jgi:hypothetical protein
MIYPVESLLVHMQHILMKRQARTPLYCSIITINTYSYDERRRIFLLLLLLLFVIGMIFFVDFYYD